MKTVSFNATKGKYLKGKIVVPQKLFDEMDELRLLGNDADHIEATEFDSIAKPEPDIAIEFTTEKLKSLYQYASLLDRLRPLRKKSPYPSLSS
jgi:hypothetical protein